MKITKFGMLALGAILAGTGVSAPAAIETEDFSYDYGSATVPISGATANSAIQEFDPSQGQLIGITFTVDSYDRALSTVFSSGAGNAYTGALVTQGTETVTANAPDLILGLTTSSLSAGPFAGTTDGFFKVAGDGSWQYNTTLGSVPSANFPSYIGTGTQALSVTVAPGTGTFSGTGGSQVGFGGQFQAYGTVQVEYTFLAIPETVYFSLCAGGVAGLVAMLACFRQPRRSII